MKSSEYIQTKNDRAMNRPEHKHLYGKNIINFQFKLGIDGYSFKSAIRTVDIPRSGIAPDSRNDCDIIIGGCSAKADSIYDGSESWLTSELCDLSGGTRISISMYGYCKAEEYAHIKMRFVQLTEKACEKFTNTVLEFNQSVSATRVEVIKCQK
ncbi:hypothetical protein GD1_204 [Paraglaciecola Antarctic GD virus 1]|nr:hypothetical protein GD1_204 [Paraglaciecola Antarctic GD virus 1]